MGLSLTPGYSQRHLRLEGLDVTLGGFSCLTDESAQPCNTKSELKIMMVGLNIIISEDES
jgi:hypothetical protein